MKTVAVYACDTIADWEFAHLTTEVARTEQAQPGRFRLEWVAPSPHDITTLGGLRITPDRVFAEWDSSRVAVLVIPGGDTYASGHQELMAVAADFVAAGIPVAAICGGTLALARSGLLDDRQHTSNVPEFLLQSGYGGGHNYREAPVVVDRGVITASGVHPVPFTAAIMREIALFPSGYVDAWERLYTTGEAAAYHAMMEALGAWQN